MTIGIIYILKVIYITDCNTKGDTLLLIVFVSPSQQVFTASVFRIAVKQDYRKTESLQHMQAAL